MRRRVKIRIYNIFIVLNMRLPEAHKRFVFLCALDGCSECRSTARSCNIGNLIQDSNLDLSSEHAATKNKCLQITLTVSIRKDERADKTVISVCILYIYTIASVVIALQPFGNILLEISHTVHVKLIGALCKLRHTVDFIGCGGIHIHLDVELFEICVQRFFLASRLFALFFCAVHIGTVTIFICGIYAIKCPNVADKRSNLFRIQGHTHRQNFGIFFDHRIAFDRIVIEKDEAVKPKI